MNDEPTVEGNPRFLELVEYARRLHIEKAAGYSGEGTDAFQNFREAEEWGATALQGCLIRMGDKYRRSQNVYHDERLDQTNEPLPKTLFDLAQYAMISIVLWEEEHPGVDWQHVNER